VRPALKTRRVPSVAIHTIATVASDCAEPVDADYLMSIAGHSDADDASMTASMNPSNLHTESIGARRWGAPFRYKYSQGRLIGMRGRGNMGRYTSRNGPLACACCWDCGPSPHGGSSISILSTEEQIAMLKKDANQKQNTQTGKKCAKRKKGAKRKKCAKRKKRRNTEKKRKTEKKGAQRKTKAKNVNKIRKTEKKTQT